MIASYHGHRVDLNTLRRRHPVSLKGVTLRGLIQIANQMHLACRPLRFELDDLRRLTLPAIVHWDMNHFVVLKTISSKGIVVHDPALGVKTYSFAEASKHLTGVALELSPTAGFTHKNEKTRLPFRTFWGQMTGVGTPLVQIFVLSVILELFVIAAPFYMQLTVDEVVVARRRPADAHSRARIRAADRHQRRDADAAVAYHPDRAERAALPHGRAAVPSPGPPAARAFSKSATSATSCRASSRSSRSATCSPRD